jgi:hypothetical protein
MARVNKSLRTFIRLDGQGRSILGSDVRRVKAPRQGRWKEIPTEPCCDGTQLSYTVVDPNGTNFTLIVKCDATTLITQVVEGTATDVATLVDLLNEKAGYLGVFTADGADVDFVIKDIVVKDLGCDGTLSFTVED